MRPTAWVPLCGAVLLLGLSPPSARAQIENCEFLPGTRNWTSRTSGSSSITYVARPRIRCNDGRYIEADSAVSFSATGYTELHGSVYFQDASQSLRAEMARYYDQMRRLEADGDVELTDRQSGNVMTGQRLIYLRPMPGRAVEELNMLGRSTATIYPSSSDEEPVPGAERPVPYDVVGDRLYMLGESRFQAFGNVEVERDSLHATADTMTYDRDAGTIDFGGRSRMQQGAIDLSGDQIRLVLPGEVIQQIIATGEATLLGDDLDLDAHLIRLYFTDEALDRLVAVGERRALGEGTDSAGPAAPQRAGAPAGRALAPDPPGDSAAVVDPAEGRARARAEGLVMTADSLDVLAPGETLEQVTAIGGARAVSTARDSLNTPDTPELVCSDWIEGDTVVAHLRPDDPAPAGPGPEGIRAPDAAGADAADERGYVLERLVATVNARSLYRMDPDEGPPEGAEVVQQPPEAPAADTLAAEPDSAVAAPDTLIVTADTLAPTPPRPTMAVHYVEADRILIVFLDGAVDTMEVTGLRRGLYMEPARRASNGPTNREP